ncbi:arginine/lysine/ornithine decarboxylase [Rivularia sp. PCC 7116]|uniref:aminotransferase class I/II-fold pyridoxal phosphate-dependent enzyme n=1 Tax=Rivularia sp. PCC 7116 TaxID=373994 RepID=UPI00029EE93E|nr:aminotransferase class I/II-fold pyridoxal phosphate-dependent enzyme [Rivularia sp. PCC 7116]AFY58942.1 arginine/lysine/ornithine decarboxylase [Rivularia sp. PCC 7116]
MLKQNQTPLLDAIISNAKRPHAPFYTPGHKQGKGISSKLVNYFGKAVFSADLTELTQLDCLFAPEGVIQEAQQLAAEAFGASQTWFLVNGSTCGIEAAIIATCRDGDKIILPRNVHSSVISGLILSGTIPIFINPEYDADLDIAHGITTKSLETALQKHADAKAVMIVYPTYYGVCGDIKAIAQLTHEYNIPLIVDEAHGAHFAFHPEFPISALAAGADLTVQSIHKTLGAMTQASMLHIQGERININRINKALQLTQSTSPSYLLLASLDAARQQIALHGKELLTRTLQLAEEARNRINQIPGFSTFFFSLSSPSLDKTRLTVTVSELGITGFEAEEILDEKFNVTPEFASHKTVTFIISLGNTESDIEQLVKAFTTLAKEYRKPFLVKEKGFSLWNHFSEFNIPHLSPRQAFFSSTQTVPIKEAINRISAETVCPYPPGIPLLIPGEIITSAVAEYLLNVKAMGGFISNCADTSLCTLKVVIGKRG